MVEWSRVAKNIKGDKIMINLQGQRFGNLIALYPLEQRNKAGLVIWKCQCDCGNTCDVVGSYLRKGQTKSCGCLKSKMLRERNIKAGKQIKVGDRFGALLVIEDLGFRKQNSRNKQERWSLCQCDCGNIIEVRNNNLNTGMTQSCGCVQSRGERIIAKILRDNNINFATQYSFPDLRSDKNKMLRFDFAIFKDNKLYKLIEFDGRQHIFGPDATWKQSDSLEMIQYRDKLKDDYCKLHNIDLLRIPYTDIENIDLQYLGLNFDN